MATDLEHEDVVETATYWSKQSDCHWVPGCTHSGEGEMHGPSSSPPPLEEKYDCFRQKYLFIWLFRVLVAVCGDLVVVTYKFLAETSGISRSLREQSLSHQTTKSQKYGSFGIIWLQNESHKTQCRQNRAGYWMTRRGWSSGTQRRI